MNETCAENLRDCPYLQRIESLERDNEHNKDTHKEFYGKLEASRTTVALIEERIRQIKADTEEIKVSVQELKDKPGKRWESIVEKAIWAVAAAVIAFLLGRVGL